MANIGAAVLRGASLLQSTVTLQKSARMIYSTVVAKAPMRSQPNHRAEMVNELLFGEVATLLSREGDFLQLQAAFDGYEGWVQRSQVATLQGAAPLVLDYVRTQVASVFFAQNAFAVPFGTPLFALSSIDFAPPFSAESYQGLVGGSNAQPNAEMGLNWQPFLGAPYLWGGKTPWGTDCSGFVQQVYKLAGVHLPRNASQQALVGQTVHFLQAAQMGDLAFFDNPEGQITHVGLLLAPDSIVHASGQVRIDAIDNHGIVHATTGERTHTLRVIKRLAQ